MIVTKLRQILIIWLVFVFCSQAVAKKRDYKRSQYYRGIAFQHVITYAVEADIDSDAQDEVLICYREPGDAVALQGGILILTERSKGYIVAWHAVFEGLYPKKVTPKDGRLDFEFVKITATGKETINKSMTRSKDFYFRGDKGDVLSKVKISASSTLKKDGIKAEHLFDRDLKTAWAEGAEGTGVDEDVTFEFPTSVGIGLIGILHGNYLGRREWQENNRLHRAEVTVETSSDRFDVESDVDFEADLGLGLYGDRIELNFSNKPVMRYFKVKKKNVLSLEVKITSVLLGEKNDDAYISEVDIAEFISEQRLFGKKDKAKESSPGAAKEQQEGNDDDWIDDDEDEAF
jgi:hypothetical protein